jgi:hypothetical protein
VSFPNEIRDLLQEQGKAFEEFVQSNSAKHERLNKDVGDIRSRIEEIEAAQCRPDVRRTVRFSFSQTSFRRKHE